MRPIPVVVQAPEAVVPDWVILPPLPKVHRPETVGVPAIVPEKVGPDSVSPEIEVVVLLAETDVLPNVIGKPELNEISAVHSDTA